jgi:hypothetical protein
VDAQGRISHLYLLIPSKINFPRTRSLDLLRAEHQGSPILDAKRRAHIRKYDVHKECQFYGSFWWNLSFDNVITVMFFNVWVYLCSVVFSLISGTLVLLSSNRSGLFIWVICLSKWKTLS